MRVQAKDNEDSDKNVPPPPRRVETLSTRMGGKDDSYVDWNDRLPLLRASKVRSITPMEAMAKLEVGNGVLIDVREESQFNQLHPTGAINIPLFIPCADDSDYDRFRKFAYKLLPALQGSAPTDRNPDFIADILDAIDEGQSVMLFCDRGGNIDKWPNPNGVESRSLIAAHELLEAGLEAGRIMHVKGGMIRWTDQGHDCSYIPEDGEESGDEGEESGSDSDDEWYRDPLPTEDDDAEDDRSRR